MKKVMSKQAAAGFDPARRAALLKLGRFAAYTAPTLSTLLIGRSAFATHNPPSQCPPTGTAPNPLFLANHCLPVDPPCEGSTCVNPSSSSFSGEDFDDSMDPAAADPGYDEGGYSTDD